MIEFSWILLFLLGIVALIDLKFKQVPSVLLTVILFLSLAFNIENLHFGLLAGLLMLLVYDVDKARTGIADFKVMIAIGLMISTLQYFFIFAITFAIFQVVYVFAFKKILKYKEEVYPFLPCLFAVYLALLIGGVI